MNSELLTALLSTASRKRWSSRRRPERAVLDELFKALLHKLIMGKIRVSKLDPSAITDKASNP